MILLQWALKFPIYILTVILGLVIFFILAIFALMENGLFQVAISVANAKGRIILAYFTKPNPLILITYYPLRLIFTLTFWAIWGEFLFCKAMKTFFSWIFDQNHKFLIFIKEN